MCYYTPRSACRNNAPLHESIMTTHAKGFGATSPVQPIPSQRRLNMQRVTCDSREARDIEFNPERERETRWFLLIVTLLTSPVLIMPPFL